MKIHTHHTIWKLMPLSYNLKQQFKSSFGNNKILCQTSKSCVNIDNIFFQVITVSSMWRFCLRCEKMKIWKAINLCIEHYYAAKSLEKLLCTLGVP